MPLARAMAGPAGSGLRGLTAPVESYRPGAGARGAVVVAGGWVGDDGGLALDRLAGADRVGGCGAVEFGDDVRAFAGAVEAVGDQCPKFELPAGVEVLTGHTGRGVPAGRPDAVGG